MRTSKQPADGSHVVFDGQSHHDIAPDVEDTGQLNVLTYDVERHSDSWRE